ncbi:MAG TPA: hypothetical protein VFQ35_28950 [Polyangiaceae bacterium]|nr:hypothetical protein [Polyangiaceae bacterium]
MIGLFALLGFAYVPLGSRTGLEHSVALIRTPAAREAIAGLVGGVVRAKDKLTQTLFPEVRESLPLPLPTAEGRPVKPLVPRLEPPHHEAAR